MPPPAEGAKCHPCLRNVECYLCLRKDIGKYPAEIGRKTCLSPLTFHRRFASTGEIVTGPVSNDVMIGRAFVGSSGRMRLHELASVITSARTVTTPARPGRRCPRNACRSSSDSNTPRARRLSRRLQESGSYARLSRLDEAANVRSSESGSVRASRASRAPLSSYSPVPADSTRA
jgi:hypothetical protein